ncbi:negative regulator of systemic acquired resistance SNI1 isoform X1 [Actinidia eriantha]|uniref:negative regulator of systemic acquired resistance SNI1 isoform X1 n=2 Tax=Actinidia eriantha TaxID=165200 RepID=UPI00258693F1|nr:negative regulator of systemic acquired resistance SNI1 isoform X1 [Actinidia eriantha]
MYVVFHYVHKKIPIHIIREEIRVSFLNPKMEDHGISSRGIEVNTLAILDASGFKKGSQDLIDDRIAFLEAVRCASIVPENGIAPTNKMCEAIFQILKDEDSMELIMASYELLTDIDKCFPRVYISNMETSPSNVAEVVVVEEAWLPFIFGSESEKEDFNKISGGTLESSGFHLLIQDLAKVTVETKIEKLETKSLRTMVLLQYVISVLEGDFVPRNSVFKENMNWNLVKESLLNMLLGSRRISYKGLIKDCLSIMCETSHVHTDSQDTRVPEKSAAKRLKYSNASVSISFFEVKKCMRTALQKFLLMVMELDMSKKKANTLGLTTRADGVRTPVVEIIQDELTYNRDSLSPFFQVFDEPKWKLEIIVQYFRKYIAKPSVRTRRSTELVEDATFDGVLKCFSNSNSVKSIIKKISTEATQMLLAHAFQAFLSLSSQHSAEGIHESTENVRDSSLAEICKNVISAFTNLRRVDEHTEILPFAKEALFVAATILSTKS